MRQLYRDLLGVTAGTALWLGIFATEEHIASHYELSDQNRPMYGAGTAVISVLAVAYAMEKISQSTM